MLNPSGLIEYSSTLADAVGEVVEKGDFPIVLGGDCSILLGAVLALKRRGRSGLLFLDGHADFYQPEAEPTGEAASMDLALVTGRGPEPVVNLESRAPLVHDEDVVVLAYRDADEAAAEGSQPLPQSIKAMDLESVREAGVSEATKETLDYFAREGGPRDFWIHLDVDVLNDAIMPAVDYRLPGGLAWQELTTVLQMSVFTGRALGLEITIFNPDLDKDDRLARELVDTLVAGLLP